MNDQRSLLAAVVLSLVVLIAWEFFVAGPQMERARKEHQAQQAGQQVAEQAPSADHAPIPSPPGEVGAPTQELGAGEPLARDIALKRSARIKINAPRVEGSIALEGARFDDLQLKGYKVTIDKGSPEVTLFSPRGAGDAYYASFGWAPSGGEPAAVPGPNTVWNVEDDGVLTPQHPVILTWHNGDGLVFIRKIALDENYMFTVTDRVENTGTKPVQLAPYGLVARHGVQNHQTFWILHEGLLGVFDAALETATYKDIAKEGRQEFTTSAPGGWLGITDKYWMAALIPDQKELITARFLDHKVDGRDVYQTDFLAPVRTVQPGKSLETTHHLFAGAKEVGIIDRYGDAIGISHFDLAIDWGWFYYLTRPVFYLLDFFNKLVGNFGIAILLLTVTIKLLLFPLANRSYEAMSKMKKLQPEMMRLRERYKDDKLKQQQELMELYKKEKVNPLAGCLPVLIQIPIFFSLYKVLFITIEMRHAPFFGWIQDLSAPDPLTIFNLFGLIPWTPPGFLHIGIWPIIMGLTMFLQTKMNPAPPDPVQEKVFLWMPVIFTFMLGTFPAGLVIYWTWNNLLSILQQYVIMRRMGVDLEWEKKFPAALAFFRRLRGGGSGNGSTRQPGE